MLPRVGKDSTPKQGANNIFDGTVIDLEVPLDEFVRPGNDPDIKAEKEARQSGGETDEINDDLGFAFAGGR